MNNPNNINLELPIDIDKIELLENNEKIELLICFHFAKQNNNIFKIDQNDFFKLKKNMYQILFKKELDCFDEKIKMIKYILNYQPSDLKILLSYIKQDFKKNELKEINLNVESFLKNSKFKKKKGYLNFLDELRTLLKNDKLSK